MSRGALSCLNAAAVASTLRTATPSAQGEERAAEWHLAAEQEVQHLPLLVATAPNLYNTLHGKMTCWILSLL